MNRDRVRKILVVGLLVLAVGAFVWFGLIRRQPRHGTATQQAASQKDVYYCPMHKNYHSDKPGTCPICSMKLVKLAEPGKAEPSVAAPPVAPSQENAIFVPPEKQMVVRESLKKLIYVQFRIEFAGSQIIFFDPAEEYFTEEMARASEEIDFLDEPSDSRDKSHFRV